MGRRPVRSRLRRPARSLTQTEIFRFIANWPELAGTRAFFLSLQAVDWIFRGPYGAFVSAPQKNVSRFRRPVLAETRFECGSVRRKAEHLALPGPFGWQVGEASDAHALREAAIDGRFDEIG